MPVDAVDLEAVRFKLRRKHFRALLTRHAIRLSVLITVDDRAHIGELMINNEVHRFCDLTLAHLAVAADAVHTTIGPIKTRRLGNTRRDTQSLTKRSSRGIKEVHAFHRIRMTIKHRLPFPKRAQVINSQLPTIIFLSNNNAERCHRGIHRRDRVTLRQHQTITRRIVRVIRRPTHRREHQCRHNVTNTHRTRRMTST